MQTTLKVWQPIMDVKRHKECHACCTNECKMKVWKLKNQSLQNASLPLSDRFITQKEAESWTKQREPPRMNQSGSEGLPLLSMLIPLLNIAEGGQSTHTGVAAKGSEIPADTSVGTRGEKMSRGEPRRSFCLPAAATAATATKKKHC